MGAKCNLLKYLEMINEKKPDFYRKTGLSNGFLDKNDNISSKNLEIIISVYEDLNLYWLITGKGEVQKQKVQEKLVSPSSQETQPAEIQRKDNENNPILAETSENIKSLINILNRTLIEKDKQIDRLLSIIEQGKV